MDRFMNLIIRIKFITFFIFVAFHAFANNGLKTLPLTKSSILKGIVTLPGGGEADANIENEPGSDEYYFIVTDKCTECKGFHDEPQCAAVCPVDCCVPDEDHVESEEVLLQKKVWMHGE